MKQPELGANVIGTLADHNRFCAGLSVRFWKPAEKLFSKKYTIKSVNPLRREMFFDGALPAWVDTETLILSA